MSSQIDPTSSPTSNGRKPIYIGFGLRAESWPKAILAVAVFAVIFALFLWGFDWAIHKF